MAKTAHWEAVEPPSPHTVCAAIHATEGTPHAMPPKKKVDLPDHVRRAALDDVALSHEQAIDAEERDKIRIFLATEQGLSTYEIAERLKVSQQVVSKWSRQGAEAYARREQARNASSGDGADRSGELIENGV